MENRQKIQRLFIFDYWCTRKLSDFIANQNHFKERSGCLAFLSHIINAQKIWYDRILADNHPDTELWHEYELGDIKREAGEIHKKWVALIGDHDLNIDTVIAYQNSRGAKFNNMIHEICTHIILHGQHHRAQINLLLRSSEIQPPSIDYIHYIRSIKE